MKENSIKLSVILPTDSFRTIQPVIQRLIRQNMSDQIEIVFVTPAPETFDGTKLLTAGFASVKVLKMDSITPLCHARGFGIRAAEGTYVFLGETHSFAQRGWAEALLGAAESGDWTAVAPGIGNANPKRIWSKIGYLSDYARWGSVMPAGEIDEAPVYNTLYRRDALLEVGDRFTELLAHGVGLREEFKTRGFRSYLEPKAKLLHLNVDTVWACFYERYLSGVLIGRQRAREWNMSRRILYILGSFLIPFVLTKRVMPGVNKLGQVERLPKMTVPLITLLMCTKVVGEVVGYAGLGCEAHDQKMDDFEIRKIDYISASK